MGPLFAKQFVRTWKLKLYMLFPHQYKVKTKNIMKSLCNTAVFQGSCRILHILASSARPQDRGQSEGQALPSSLGHRLPDVRLPAGLRASARRWQLHGQDTEVTDWRVCSHVSSSPQDGLCHAGGHEGEVLHDQTQDCTGLQSGWGGTAVF